MFEHSASEQIAVSTPAFVHYFDNPLPGEVSPTRDIKQGPPDAIITDKPWGHLDMDGITKDIALSESAVEEVCKGWYRVQALGGRVVVRMHDTQVTLWKIGLEKAGYTVWRNPIRTVTNRRRTHQRKAFPKVNGLRVSGGTWLVAYKVVFCVFILLVVCFPL